MNALKKLFTLFIITLLYSCGGSSGGGGETPPPPPPPPTPKATTLIAPADKTECLDGENVEFSWNASENTDSYTIIVKNLLTAQSVSQTTTSTKVTIKLEVGQPYSWYVVSSSNTSTTTAESGKWKFYLKGEQTLNYAPFPADLTSPKSESSVDAGSIKFEWSGSDVDSGDTLTYDIYIDSANPPTTRVRTGYASSTLDYTISEGGTYYWKIVTKDNHGSNSESGISMFKVVE